MLSLSNLVQYNTFLHASLLHNWCKRDSTVTLCSKHNNKGLILLGCFFPKRSNFVTANEQMNTKQKTRRYHFSYFEQAQVSYKQLHYSSSYLYQKAYLLSS